MINQQAKFQIGKQGLTDGVIQSIALALKNHKQVRVSVLKSAREDKSKIKEIAEEITSSIPHLKHRIIGYTIILVKQLKKKR